MNRTNAIVTASYAPDFERCQILCESIDRHVTGHRMHYILVDTVDEPLFAGLAEPKRAIITEDQLLPWWLKRLPSALSPGGRRVWVSALTLPLHGWHVQQLKRIAIAHLIGEDALFYCDSDTAFVRDFDCTSVWQDGRLRLYRKDHAARSAEAEHLQWIAHADQALGIEPRDQDGHDYVGTFLAWKRQTVVEMCAHMERTHGRPWMSVIGKSRTFSECMLYGAYVDRVLSGEGHYLDSETLCPIFWHDPTPTDAELRQAIAELTPHEVGIGVQSFIPMEPDRFRTAVLGNPALAA